MRDHPFFHPSILPTNRKFPTFELMEMYKTGPGDIFVVVIVAAIFILGIYVLLKFRKNKNF
ncbi:MAG: hypothetical protein IAF38_20750 [Bacteroidia bacterium]|nr:hypothetical protein [Bacteroidia bacterium]